MEKRKLGSSGLDVSVVGLGCNNIGMIPKEASERVVHRALDAGITLFDTADIYGNRGGSETQLGEILGSRRKAIVLATKFGMQMDEDGAKSGAARRYIAEAVNASLRRLNTDWIDLYQLHRPDPKTPIEETLRALDDLVQAGKVRFIGCSNMAPWQVVEFVLACQNQRIVELGHRAGRIQSSGASRRARIDSGTRGKSDGVTALLSLWRADCSAANTSQANVP